MAKQAQNLIPGDTILVTLVQADKQNGVINREYLFDGTGAQRDKPNARKLVLPKMADEAETGPVPTFPVEDYLALIKKGDMKGAGKLQGEFHEKLLKTTKETGQQALANVIIDAVFEFLKGENLDGWVVNKDGVVCRIPARATPETPVVIVLQPQPVYGD